MKFVPHSFLGQTYCILNNWTFFHPYRILGINIRNYHNLCSLVRRFQLCFSLNHRNGILLHAWKIQFLVVLSCLVARVIYQGVLSTGQVWHDLLFRFVRRSWTKVSIFFFQLETKTTFTNNFSKVCSPIRIFFEKYTKKACNFEDFVII